MPFFLALAPATVESERHLELHRRSLDRELYVVHTDRRMVDITERTWLGVRLAL